MRKIFFLQSSVVLLLGLGIGIEAQAAESVARLTRLEGKVLVNKGKNYTAAQVGMPLERGNRVLIPAGGSAQLVYKDGCVLPLGPNSFLTIGSQTQCTEGAVVAQFNPDVRLAQAGGGPVTTPAPAESVSSFGGIPWPAWVAAAGITALVICAASDIICGGGGGNHHHQISPE